MGRDRAGAGVGEEGQVILDARCGLTGKWPLCRERRRGSATGAARPRFSARSRPARGVTREASAAGVRG